MSGLTEKEIMKIISNVVNGVEETKSNLEFKPSIDNPDSIYLCKNGQIGQFYSRQEAEEVVKVFGAWLDNEV